MSADVATTHNIYTLWTRIGKKQVEIFLDYSIFCSENIYYHMHRDKELFAATYIIEIIIYATYLVFQFENKYYFDANIKSKIR